MATGTTATGAAALTIGATAIGVEAGAIAVGRATRILRSPSASSISPSPVSSRMAASLRMKSVSISNLAMRCSRNPLARQQAGECLEGQEVPLAAEAGDHADRSRTYIGVMPEGFTLVDVGKMHFDCRQFGGVQRVEQGHRGVGIGPGIDHDSRIALAGGL